MILDNRQITIKEVADDVDISFGSCQVIFTYALGIKAAAVEIVKKIAKFLAKPTSHDIFSTYLKPVISQLNLCSAHSSLAKCNCQHYQMSLHILV